MKARLVCVAGAYHGYDLDEEIKERFSKEVEAVFLECRQWFLSQELEVSFTSGGNSKGQEESSKRTSDSMEAVKLPSFKIEEKQLLF